MDAMVCRACRSRNEADASFCATCGAGLGAATPLPAAATVPQAGAPVRNAPAAWRPPPASTDRTPALLELIPVFAAGAYVVSVVAVEVLGFPALGESPAVWTLLGLGLLVSGAGWISIGRAGLGCALMAVRAIVLVVAFIAFAFSVAGDWGCEGSACGASQIAGAVAMLGGLAALILVPILSAVMLARRTVRDAR